MKQLIIATLLIILSLPSIAKSQDQKGFEITGHIDGVQDGEKVLLCHYPFSWVAFSPFPLLPIDSCIVKNGEFHLQAVDTVGGPHLYHLKFEWPRHHLNAAVDNGAAMTCELLIANGEHITIHGGNIDKFPERDISHYVGIDGSPSTLAYNALASSVLAFERSISSINHDLGKVRENVGYDRSMVGAYIESKNHIINNVVSLFFRYPDGNWRPAVPIFMWNLIDGFNHAQIIMDMYNSMDESQKNSYYGRKIKEYADLSVGQPFPDFTLPNPEGKSIALKDILLNSKITLVHIWGSQSIDRAKYQDELRQHYKKYHDKGLNIIGVSADTTSYVFKGFVSEQKYPWENVSDLQGWDNHGTRKSIIEDVFLEGGHGTPNTTNVLLDNTGKIIDWDVNGVELQWYLEKYLGD
jgi:peroxiredoxin